MKLIMPLTDFGTVQKQHAERANAHMQMQANERAQQQAVWPSLTYVQAPYEQHDPVFAVKVCIPANHFVRILQALEKRHKEKVEAIEEELKKEKLEKERLQQAHTQAEKKKIEAEESCKTAVPSPTALCDIQHFASGS